MITLASPDAAQGLQGRLARLTPSHRAQRGRMNARQMVCHLNDSFLLALGEKSASPDTSVFKRSAMKWAALWLPAPWPRGIATRPEMDQEIGGTPPAGFDSDVARLNVLLGRFHSARGFGIHPIFGAMSTREWMRWGYLHSDHHFRQFGI